MSDETKQKLWGILLIFLTAVAGLVANLANPTPAPVNPTPVNVTVESKPGVFGGAPPAVRVEPTKE
jgi:hypothetical protein